MSGCHCRRCRIDESGRGTGLRQTTNQTDPCNATETEYVIKMIIKFNWGFLQLKILAF